MLTRRTRSDLVVRVKRSDRFDQGAFTWEICRKAFVRAQFEAGRGFATEAEARLAGVEALNIVDPR